MNGGFYFLGSIFRTKREAECSGRIGSQGLMCTGGAVKPNTSHNAIGVIQFKGSPCHVNFKSLNGQHSGFEYLFFQ